MRSGKVLSGTHTGNQMIFDGVCLSSPRLSHPPPFPNKFKFTETHAPVSYLGVFENAARNQAGFLRRRGRVRRPPPPPPQEDLPAANHEEKKMYEKRVIIKTWQF